jgi:D-glucosaminate-6-phosphate ammonia-lyase
MGDRAQGAVQDEIYGELGLRPVINCSGFYLTVLGGSMLSPTVQRAMDDANRYFVDMREMLERSGKIIADLVGAEAALVTAGCSAAMILGVAASMAGKDADKASRLPDTTGMRNEIIIQAGQRYKYDRTLTIPGAKLVEVGDAAGTSPGEIEEAINENTVLLHYVASGNQQGIVPIEEILRIGQKYNIAVMVDGAGQVYPVEKMQKYTSLGVDLVAHSSKYFGGPNSAGFLAGRKELIDAAFMHSFVGFEYGPPRTVGRGMKVDRQEVVAVVAALREWMTMDHAARFATYRTRAEKLQAAIQAIPHVQEVALHGDPVTGVRIDLDASRVSKSTAQIADELKAGNPSIWFHWDLSMYVQKQAAHSMVFSVETIADGDEPVIAARLQAVLAG